MGFGTIAIVVVVLVAAYFVMVYNRLVTHRNRFKNAFSQIDVQLQRRYELIPNLVEIAKKYVSICEPRQVRVSRCTSSGGTNPGQCYGKIQHGHGRLSRVKGGRIAPRFT